MFKITPDQAYSAGYIFTWCIGINTVIILSWVVERVLTWHDHKKRLAHAANMDEPVRK